MSFRYSISILALFFLSSCSPSTRIDREDSRFSLKLLAGGQHGGIIENTNMELIPDVPPDAFTGATRTGVHAGVHFEYLFDRISLEGGIDGFINGQTFTYKDDINGYNGTRDILFTQARIPLTVSIILFKNYHQNGLLQVKAGFSTGLCHYDVFDNDEGLPFYVKDNFCLGPALGLEVHPFRFYNGQTLGFSFELSRSAQLVYNDFYQLGELPGVSYIRFGLAYRIPVF